MKKEKKGTNEDFMKKNFITCTCGYNNKISNIKTYGTCLRCGKILDDKANFNRQLFLRMRDKQKKIF